MPLKIQKMRFNCEIGFGFEKEAMRQTQWANLELQTLKTRQNGNQMIHKAQRCTVGYLAKNLLI